MTENGTGVKGMGWQSAGRVVGHRRGVHVAAGVLLLPLGPAVLEPNLHLRLGQAESEGEVEALADAQVSRLFELVLEGDQLLVREGGARAPGLAAGPAARV